MQVAGARVPSKGVASDPVCPLPMCGSSNLLT